MKYIIMLLFLTVIGITSKAQENRKLALTFNPSFSSHSILTITESEKKAVIKLQIFDKNDTRNVTTEEGLILNRKDLDSLLSFLSTYQFKTQGSIDTIGTSEVIRNGETVTAYKISSGLDGITVKGTFKSESETEYFAFWSPKANTENHKLIMKAFELMEGEFQKKSVKNYLTGLKGYF